ncbi:MAG: hypothetical protein AAGF98_19200 [Cyanobacteria bacterium P01_H01_bin.153]
MTRPKSQLWRRSPLKSPQSGARAIAPHFFAKPRPVTLMPTTVLRF